MSVFIYLSSNLYTYQYVYRRLLFNLCNFRILFCACTSSQFYHSTITSSFKLARKVSHWVSSSGADMARFFLPSLFPKVDKLLYLDNDVIVTCCVEEVWNTKMTEEQIVGQPPFIFMFLFLFFLYVSIKFNN